MSTAIRVDQKTYRQLVQNLQALPRRVGLRVYRIALNAWGGIVKDVEKRTAKKATGLLRRSIAVKVKIPDASYNVQHHGKPAYVMVGPSRAAISELVQTVTKTGKFKSKRRISTSGKQSGEGGIRRASRYAHLVEQGIAGRSRIAPAPFVEPAARAGEGPGFQKFAQKMEQGIAAEAAKLPKG